MDLIKQSKQFALWKSKEDILQIIQNEQAKSQHNSDVQLKDIKEHFVEYSQLLSTMQNIKQVGNNLQFEEKDFQTINNDVKRYFGEIGERHSVYEKKVFQQRQELQNQTLFQSINQLTLYVNQKADFQQSQFDEICEAIQEALEAVEHSADNQAVAQNIQQLQELILTVKKRLLDSLGFITSQIQLEYEYVVKTPLLHILKQNEKQLYLPQKLKTVFKYLNQRYNIFKFKGVININCIQLEVLNCAQCCLYAIKQLLNAANDVQTFQANKKQKFVSKDKKFFTSFKEFLSNYRQYIEQEKDNQPFASNKFDNKEISSDILKVSELLDYTCIFDNDQRTIYSEGCKFVTQVIENAFLLLQNAEQFMNLIQNIDDETIQQINLTKLLFRKFFAFMLKQLAQLFLDQESGRFYRFQTIHYQIIGQITTWRDTKMLDRFPDLQKIFISFLEKIQGACLHTLNLSMNTLVKNIASLYFKKQEDGYLIQFLRQLEDKYEMQMEGEERKFSFIICAMCEVVQAFFDVIKHFGVTEEENFRMLIIQLFLNIFYTYIDIIYLYGQQHKNEMELIYMQNDLFLLMNRVFKYGILKYENILRLLGGNISEHYTQASLKDLIQQDRHRRLLSFDEHLLQPSEVRKLVDADSIKAQQNLNLDVENVFAQLQDMNISSLKQQILQLLNVAQRASRVLLSQFEKAVMPHFRVMVEDLLTTIIEQSAIIFIGQKQINAKDLSPLFEQYLANELGVQEQRKVEKILNITSINQILIRYLDNYQRFIMQFADPEVQVILIQDIQIKTCVIIKMMLTEMQVNELQAYSIAIVFGYIIKCLKTDPGAVFPKIIVNQKETAITSLIPSKIVTKLHTYLDQIFAGYLI